MTAFEHCIGTHRQDARWIAFLDVDEFLFTPNGGSLPEVLSDYEEYPGVVVNRAEFGPSGHLTKPEGLVIESYVQRRPLRPDDESAHKSIVDPSRVTRCLGAHSFMYVDGPPVDEQKRPVDMMRRTKRKPVTWTRLRAHHYWSRSEEERRNKAELWSEVGSLRRRRRPGRVPGTRGCSGTRRQWTGPIPCPMTPWPVMARRSARRLHAVASRSVEEARDTVPRRLHDLPRCGGVPRRNGSSSTA